MNAHRTPMSLSEGAEPVPKNHRWDILNDGKEMVIYDESNEDAWILSDIHTSEVTIR